MDIPRTAKLHLEIDVEFSDPQAVQTYARTWAREQSGDDCASLAAKLSQAAESPESALTMLVEPDDVLGEIPGVMALGASMWIDGADDAGSDADAAWPAEDDLAKEAESEDEGESEEDWLHTIFTAAEKLPGLDLASLGYSTSELNPDVRAQNLLRATNLRGAIHWAYEDVIDQLFDDVQTLRSSPDSLEETLQLGALPPVCHSHIDALFAQRFLVVALDLGSSLATAFNSPSCVAQELALKLLLDGVEGLEEMLPELELPQDWRDLVRGTLFIDLDHEESFLAGDGTTDSAPLAEDLPELSDWFTPFVGRTLNPYAANE